MESATSQLLLEENEWQCTKFNENSEWQLKDNLVSPAMTDQLPVAVEVRLRDHKIFHASRIGGWIAKPVFHE